MRACVTGLGVLVLWMATFAGAEDSKPVAEKDSGESAEAIVKGIPIDTGFVIIRGEYLPSPYVVGTRGEELFLNDQRLDTEQLQVRHWGGFGGGWRGPDAGGREGFSASPGGDRTRRPYSYFNYAAYLEERLQGNSLLVVFNDGMATFIQGNEGAVLEALLSSKPRDAKVQALMQTRAGRIESARWAELVDSFKPSPELADRVKKLTDQQKVRHRPVARTPSLSNFVKYGITVMGIVLGVLALGSLLTHRPMSKAGWSEVDTAGDSIPMVSRNVILVAVLGFFDLACTVMAQGSIGFVEMNPLGSGLLQSPTLLAAFKVASLSVGCVILLALRRYRGAQVASWWLCLVCTILTFRWATYGTLFLA